jgi:hypothetical protein
MSIISSTDVSKENRPLLPNVMASPAIKTEQNQKRESLGSARLSDAAAEAVKSWRLRITDILKSDAATRQPEQLVQAFATALDHELPLETYRNHAHYVELWCLRVRHEGAGKAKFHLDFMKKNSIGVRNAYYYIEQARPSRAVSLIALFFFHRHRFAFKIVRFCLDTHILHSQHHISSQARFAPEKALKHIEDGITWKAEPLAFLQKIHGFLKKGDTITLAVNTAVSSPDPDATVKLSLAADADETVKMEPANGSASAAAATPSRQTAGDLSGRLPPLHQDACDAKAGGIKKLSGLGKGEEMTGFISLRIDV